MKILNKSSLKAAGLVIISVSLILGILAGLTVNSGSASGANVTNSTVLARVNVSNTQPTVYNVEITNPAPPIDLLPDNVTVVTCNASVRDYNGYDDIMNVTGILYFDGTLDTLPDDNNTHYSNSSCGTCTEIPDSGSKNGTCLCNFAVQYFANPGEWRCNVSVNDSGGLSASNFSLATYTINELLAIKLNNMSLDYGAVSVTQTSAFTPKNITNVGNIPINITLRGYGGDNESIGENYTMLCESGANISFGYQRFSLSNTALFGDMYNLTNQTTQIPGLTLPRRVLDSSPGNSTNTTYWKLNVPASVGGICNGTIVFGAVDATEN